VPSPEENVATVTKYAEEVFNSKNLDYAEEWLADDFGEHQGSTRGLAPTRRVQSTRTGSSSKPCPT
jgi:hypothetical protein